MKWLKSIVKTVLPPKQAQAIGPAYELACMALHDLRVDGLGQLLPMKPRALSLMANDICNSRCQMCLIWKQKRDKEISPEELRAMLSTSFFQQLEYVGVTGGEPTLRKDLPELFEVICSSLPKLRGPSLITNAIQLKQVIPRVLEAAEVCRRHSRELAVMVSLDGYGEVHDAVRGRKGNFDTAIEALEVFRQHGLRPSFGCTITSTNAPYVDELLDYAKAHKLYGRFRMAEFIDRLYNNDVFGVIRSFDDQIAYHLGLFFFRLEYDFETSSMYRKTYRNIRGMVAEGKRREIACPYQTQSVIVSARGELLYCSPKSPNLGSILDKSPERVYLSNLHKRRAMIEKDCDNCIHDYHVPVTAREKVTFWLECRRRSRVYTSENMVVQAARLQSADRCLSRVEPRSTKVLIVGWYGTETVGDKAILWSVIENLKNRLTPPQEIVVASLYPFITKRTLRELSLDDVTIVETYTKQFEQCCSEVGEVVVGGGPLMDLEALDHMLYAFIAVRKSGGLTRVEGCGLGPLREERYITLVRHLFRLANQITLRDRASAERAAKQLGIKDCSVVPDPAVEFVLAQLKAQPIPQSSGLVSCFLREWSKEYAAHLTENDFAEQKRLFTENLVRLLSYVSSALGSNIELLPMHCFHIGGDDRVYNRALEKELSSCESARLPVSAGSIVGRMRASAFNICMRYHSVVFAETLGVPYLAIDYTLGGKIRSFLSDHNRLEYLVTVDEIIACSWKEKVDTILSKQKAVNP